MIKLNLKEHRIKNKLTQDELAIKSKVSQTYISRLENNISVIVALMNVTDLLKFVKT